MTISELTECVRGRSITPQDFLRELVQLSEHVELPREAYEPGALTLYRTQVLSGDKQVKKIGDISYPPAGESKMQRANTEGEQVLYVSTRIEASLSENPVSTGDRVVVATWRNTVVTNTIRMSIEPKDDLATLYHVLFNDPDDSMYAYSSAVAQRLMSIEPLTGIQYPSKADTDTDENIGFSKIAADQLLAFECAELYRVTEVEGYTYTLEKLDTALIEGTDLKWKNA